jgi:tRNA(Glu) U13 pseudouridine synthase TruD
MLPSSSYATMLIREITRGSTSRATHAALTGKQNLLKQQQQQEQGHKQGQTHQEDA